MKGEYHGIEQQTKTIHQGKGQDIWRYPESQRFLQKRLPGMSIRS